MSLIEMQMLRNLKMIYRRRGRKKNDIIGDTTRFPIYKNMYKVS